MTNEVAQSELEIQQVPGRLSLEAFLDWHNPLDLNQQQVLPNRKHFPLADCNCSL